ncbi:MAG TPA: hypothetical protein VGQ91_06000 [Ideonella sp.]|nr:hypothetical protein [Ideonella sp.]
MGSLTGFLMGCSPTLDWREARLEAGLIAMFPCRPVAQSRQLVLAGAPVTMSLSACEAGGKTYAVGLADVADPARVGPALAALREASEAKLARAASAASGALGVDGMTPQAMAGRWHLSGQRPEGEALAMETAAFARGTWVVQASVIGGQLPAQAVGPFFEGLRFRP